MQPISIPIFADFKMRVYGMKHESLWDAVFLKMRVYGMKHESLWDAVFLKMRVYGMCL